MTNDVYTHEERRSKKLAQVRKLLAKADSTNHPGEADVFRAKADELMTAFAIEAFEITGHDDDARRPEPTSRPMDINWYYESDRDEELWHLMLVTAQNCRVKLVHWAVGRNARTGTMEIPAVGMPADLDYFDMLFTHLYQQMNKGLEPKPDVGKTMIENLVAMKEAGMKWERIGELLFDAGQLSVPYTRNMGVKFTKLYTDYCNDTNRPRLRTSPQTYQRNYAQGFVRGVAAQFDERRKLQEEAPTMSSVAPSAAGTAIALRDIKQVVDEKATDLFGKPPRRRGGYRQDNRRYDPNAYSSGKVDGRRADTSGGKGRSQVTKGRKELNR